VPATETVAMSSVIGSTWTSSIIHLRSTPRSWRDRRRRPHVEPQLRDEADQGILNAPLARQHDVHRTEDVRRSPRRRTRARRPRRVAAAVRAAGHRAHGEATGQPAPTPIAPSTALRRRRRRASVPTKQRVRRSGDHDARPGRGAVAWPVPRPCGEGGGAEAGRRGRKGARRFRAC
jgi:hypothetical protein